MKNEFVNMMQVYEEGLCGLAAVISYAAAVVCIIIFFAGGIFQRSALYRLSTGRKL